MPKTICRLALAILLVMMPTAVRAQSPTDRASDNLLARPDLEAIVDLQVERDAAALIERLGDPDPAVRARAAFALASVQDSTAVPALLALLDDSDPAVQADAAFALGQSSARIASSALLKALRRSTDAAVQRRLIEALGKKGDQASLASLISWAEDDTLFSTEVTLAVGRYALRDLHAPKAVAHLVKHLNDADPLAQLHAAYYFGRSRDTTAWAPLADTLRTLLDSLPPDAPAAMHLVLGIGRLGDPADTPRLLHVMKTAEDWRTRVNAVRALSARTDESGIRAALYDRLVDPSVHVAVTAAQTLNDGKAWSKKDADLIKQWTQYNGYAWRITAPLLAGLAQQGETTFVLNELEHRRNSRNPLAYAQGLPALAHLPYNVAIDLLVNAAHSQDSRVASAALSTLATRWQDDRNDPRKRSVYFDIFAYGLRRKDPATVGVSARALGDSLFRASGALELLQDVYEQLDPSEDLDAMTGILRALGASGNPAAAAFLRREMTHEHRTVIVAAGQALEALTGEASVLPSGVEPPDRTINWAYLHELGPHPQLVLATTKGTITLVLDAEQAPLTVQTLAQFARAGQFDDVPFHRVVPNFVIQGGDFARRDGRGGPPFSIRSEFTRIPYVRGTIGMASSGKDTEGSQYFITHRMQPHLDGRYTAFGYVLEGLDAVDTIYEDDRVTRASVVPDK
jgi:cyclophilin family peptidyl-prolyl cis-trans isomerase